MEQGWPEEQCQEGDLEEREWSGELCLWEERLEVGGRYRRCPVRMKIHRCCYFTTDGGCFHRIRRRGETTKTRYEEFTNY